MGFTWAAFSVLIATVLAYIPYFARVFLLRRFGKYDNTSPKDYERQVCSMAEDKQELIKRLVGCHVNQMETLSVYAAGVAANLTLGRNSDMLIVLTALYIVFRIAYIAAYVGPQYFGGYVRSGMFVGSIIMVMLLWVRAAF